MGHAAGSAKSPRPWFLLQAQVYFKVVPPCKHSLTYIAILCRDPLIVITYKAMTTECSRAMQGQSQFDTLTSYWSPSFVWVLSNKLSHTYLGVQCTHLPVNTRKFRGSANCSIVSIHLTFQRTLPTSQHPHIALTTVMLGWWLAFESVLVLVLVVRFVLRTVE